MKALRPLIIPAIFFLAIIIISSCGSTEEKLTGSWITESVVADIDSTKASPSDLAKIEHAINSQKTVQFVLNEDHSMTLTIDGYQSEAIWSFSDKDNTVSFRFDQASVGDAIELGKYESGDIVYTSKVIHGMLTTVYIKE